MVNYFLSFGGFLAMTSFLKSYYMQHHNMDEKEAAMVNFVFSLLSSLTRCFYGYFTDKFGGYHST